MSGLDWRNLAVEGEGRSVIYSGTFPSRLDEALTGGRSSREAPEAFDATAALEVLATFAGARGSLHRDAQGHRWQYRSVITASGQVLVLAFRAVALDPDERWVVVDDVHRPT